ncbi:hypothetical protein IFM89_014591 [Coptis chinensis]|uniref:FAD dependent oxidoreductase domain-containing protein n=1 Tax=Coptis chinensis TaxID=261450 RepID=A0A835LBV1_9MAGN|nr:hypothetical protein IFM89_014591 [Coptis chinensis]
MSALLVNYPSLCSSINFPSFYSSCSLNNKSSSLVVAVSSSVRCFSSLSPHPPLRYAILGAGFAGLSVAWHLLQTVSKDSHLCIDIYDEVGIGGGASGVAGGLLHPYSPKAKLLWKGAECWEECLKLLNIAEAAVASRKDFNHDGEEVIVWRRGILRPATTVKNVDILTENARDCLRSCKLESVDEDGAQNLVPNLCVPFNSAIYMPQAVNVHPQRYLQALFLACKNQVLDLAASGYEGKEIYLHKKSVNSLLELAGDYNAVIICLGANSDTLPELSGWLPLRTCRGVVAHLQLPNDVRDEYGAQSPSILSDAWIAAQGPRNLVIGSTWEWRSRNYSPKISAEEASLAFDELLLKASDVYPSIRKWDFTGARAGLRAMPPLTPFGSIPVLGCVDDAIIGNRRCKYWVFTGLGARGLLYHGWLGKLMAQAVHSGNEDVLPLESTSWRKIRQ